MKIAVHVPFGMQRKESGGIFLLAHYLKHLGVEVESLNCDGVVSLCERYDELQGPRPLEGCFSCIREQVAYQDWSTTPSLPLSSFITSKEVKASREWVASFESGELLHAEIDGVLLHSLCKGSFASRFGVEYPDFSERGHERFYRRLFTSAVRLVLGYRSYVKQSSPDLMLGLGGESYFTKCFSHVAQQSRAASVEFRWDTEEGQVCIASSEQEMVMKCHLLFESVSSMRPDITTWPDELVRLVEDILIFIGVSEAQLQLPIAGNSSH